MLKRSLSLLPARTELYQAKLGFYLLLASLGMFFIGSMVVYATIRLSEERVASDASNLDSLPDRNQPMIRAKVNPFAGNVTRDVKPVKIPTILIVSTTLLLVISATLHVSVLRVSKEQQFAFKKWLVVSLFLSTAFMWLQSFGLYDLLAHHFQGENAENKMYGIAFTLAFIHFLHVFAGLVFLTIVVVNAFRNCYDHERHWRVDLCAGYWHFLDVIWIMMLGTFLITQ